MVMENLSITKSTRCQRFHLLEIIISQHFYFWLRHNLKMDNDQSWTWGYKGQSKTLPTLQTYSAALIGFSPISNKSNQMTIRTRLCWTKSWYVGLPFTAIDADFPPSRNTLIMNYKDHQFNIIWKYILPYHLCRSAITTSFLDDKQFSGYCHWVFFFYTLICACSCHNQPRLFIPWAHVGSVWSDISDLHGQEQP